MRGCLCRANRSGSDSERIVGLLRFRCRDLPRSFGESHHGCGQRTSGHHGFRVVQGHDGTDLTKAVLHIRYARRSTGHVNRRALIDARLAQGRLRQLHRAPHNFIDEGVEFVAGDQEIVLAPRGGYGDGGRGCVREHFLGFPDRLVQGMHDRHLSRFEFVGGIRVVVFHLVQHPAIQHIINGTAAKRVVALGGDHAEVAVLFRTQHRNI